MTCGLYTIVNKRVAIIFFSIMVVFLYYHGNKICQSNKKVISASIYSPIQCVRNNILTWRSKKCKYSMHILSMLFLIIDLLDEKRDCRHHYHAYWPMYTIIRGPGHPLLVGVPGPDTAICTLPMKGYLFQGVPVAMLKPPRCTWISPEIFKMYTILIFYLQSYKILIYFNYLNLRQNDVPNNGNRSSVA